MKIGIFATSTPIWGERNENTYKKLEELGFDVYESPQCRMVHNDYLAGNIKERVNAIHDLFTDKSIDIVMAFWGGQNTNEVLPCIDYELIEKNRKPIIGYSDTTALLLAIYKETKCPTFIGCSALTFSKPEPISHTVDCFKKIFIDKDKTIDIYDSKEYSDDEYYLKKPPLNESREIKENDGRKIFRKGLISGEVVGANIQTLLVLAGTKYFPNFDDKILFLEEAEECDSPAKLHRYLTHLNQAIDFNKIKGVCFGRLTPKTRIKDDSQLRQIFTDVFWSYNFPFIYNLDFGHTDPSIIVPNGAECFIDTEKNILKFEIK